MAFILTYSSLVGLTLDYIQRVDVNTALDIPSLIASAEVRLARAIKPRGFERQLRFALSPGQNVYQKPTRWRETISMLYGAGLSGNAATPVLQREYEYVRDFAPDGSVIGPPRFFADFGYDHWLIGPTPDKAYNVLLDIYERIQPLDANNQTNWLTDQNPDLIRGAVLREAALLLKNDTDAQKWDQYVATALQAMGAEEDQRLTDRTMTPSIDAQGQR